MTAARTRTTRSRAFASLARGAAAGVATGVVLLVVAAGCGETRRPLGDECLRDEDCLSSACSGRVCVASPPLTNDQLGLPDRGAKLPDATSNLPQDAGGPVDG